MRKNYNHIALFFLFVASVLFALTASKIFTEKEKKPQYEQMEKAVELAAHWFDLVHKEKLNRGLVNKELRSLKYGGLMGKEYSDITTTLGSAEAKQTAINPQFAALTYSWLIENDIDSNSIVGVNISGSFPSIAISVLAAIQTIGAEAVMISSLGASSFGANEPGFTWIDIEELLRANANLRYKSVLITPGGINDNGGGLQPEGIKQIENAALRNGREIFFPKVLIDAIETRIKIFDDSKIDLLINIGGNHPALGNCSHSWQIPNGVIPNSFKCSHKERSFLFHFIEKDIPVIHFLNIKELAAKNGLQIAPYSIFNKSETVYYQSSLDKLPILIGVILLFFAMLLISGRIGIISKKKKIFNV